MADTVGVRFREAGKIFYHDAAGFELTVGSRVIVGTARGEAVGRVVIAPDQVIVNESSQADRTAVLRLASDEDIEKWDDLREKAKVDVQQARTMAAALALDLTISGGEYDLSGGQFTAYFTATQRPDYRILIRDLSKALGARVQMVQVGDRDRAKLADGVDICGERLCCSSWMTDFPSVSIRMAKEQDLPLNPQKISGVCGRLYCCLTFEYDDYKALRGTLPKVGAMLSTPAGEAKVTGIDFNREIVKLWLTEEREAVEVAAIDFKLQNGVTIRPMEIVRKVEGPLRTIVEDSEARAQPAPGGATRDRPAGQRETPPPRERPAGQRPARERPAARRDTPTPPPAPTPPTAGPTEGGEPGQQQRKRRRRRGRGRGGGGSGPAPPATPPAGDGA